MDLMKFIFPIVFICSSLSYALSGSIAGGEWHSLALKEDGAVWAWGADSLGELGDGTASPEGRNTPGQVVGLSEVIAIAVGDSHSLALRRDGTVWAWGYNAFGQLGNGTADGMTTKGHPTPELMIGVSDVIAIAAGNAVSFLLRSDGTVWATGSNRNGGLGDGTTTDRSTPVQVIELSGVTAIAGGCVALKSDGTVWQWGWSNTVPVQVNGLSNIIAIASGSGHSLALTQDGTVWAWGNNWSGQLGDGNHGTNSFTPVKSLISGVIAIEGGESFSLAVDIFGTVWFWGVLSSFTSDYIWSITPVPVNGISGVIAVAGGRYHALALKDDGTIWAWGANDNGQLGNGTNDYYGFQRYPVQVKEFSTGGSASMPSTVLAADFDEDGKADPVAVSDAGDLFYWNSSQSFSRQGPMAIGPGGTPAVGDADGDGKADMALVDAGGWWHFYLSSRGYLPEAQNLQPTVNSPQPLLADFDGDGKADPTIVSSSGLWTVWLSADNYSPTSAQFLPSTAYSLQPVSADFDADGLADPVMVTSAGGWYLWPSSQMYTQHGPYDFQVSGKPVAADFDGDRKADPCIVDSTGNWNLFLSAAFYLRSGPWYLVLP